MTLAATPRSVNAIIKIMKSVGVGGQSSSFVEVDLKALTETNGANHSKWFAILVE